MERKLAAIFCADVADYSRLMHADEVQTLRTLTAHRAIMDGLIAQHGGRIANTAGDSVLAEFPSVVDAIECAVAVQEKLGEANAGVPDDKALRFRIGVHVGDVMVRGGDLLGNGVNVAARIQALAEPGGVWISGRVHEEVEGKVRVGFEDRGEQQVRNIARPLRLYALTFGAPSPIERKALPLPDKPSIAVLPFTNMSGDPEQGYFVDGIVADIITALSRVKRFFVIAGRSSFAYRGSSVDVSQVARELGVRFILEGSVRKSGDRIRINAQLVEAATGHHAWADRFEGDLAEVFDLQDQVAERVAGAVEPTIRGLEVERARAKPTEHLDAYDLYLRALPLHFSGAREKLSEAQMLLGRALEVDPHFSLAKAFSALTTVVQLNQGWAAESAVSEAITLARSALAQDRDDPVTLRCIGHSLAYLAQENDLAMALLDRALSLNPSSAEAHHSAGWVCNFAGDGGRASEHFERTIRLSPLDPEMGHTLTGLAFAKLLMERYEDALDTSRSAMALLPSSLPPLRAAIVASMQLGKVEQARKMAQQILALSPSFSAGQFRRVQPFRHAPFVETYMSALRAAGLPE